MKSLVAVVVAFLFLTSCTNDATRESRPAFTTIGEALQDFYEDKEGILIFQTGEFAESLYYVLYTVNEEALICELLTKTELGFVTVGDSRLQVDGIPLKQVDHKIRTFELTEGPWHQSKGIYTYVSFGYIKEPKTVDYVEIRFTGEYQKVFTENETFFSTATAIGKWDRLHPVIFYNREGQELGGYMKDFLDGGGFCH